MEPEQVSVRFFWVTILALEPTDLGGYDLAVMQQVKIKTKILRSPKPKTRLSPRQLRRLADRMVASSDPAEVARLKEALERGFYGDLAHA